MIKETDLPDASKRLLRWDGLRTIHVTMDTTHLTIEYPNKPLTSFFLYRFYTNFFFSHHCLLAVYLLTPRRLEIIDFQRLAKDLAYRQDSLYARYSYIYKSDELKKINEALAYGFSSLKNHLLLMVNLYLNDNRRNRGSLSEA